MWVAAHGKTPTRNKNTYHEEQTQLDRNKIIESAENIYKGILIMEINNLVILIVEIKNKEILICEAHR